MLLQHFIHASYGSPHSHINIWLLICTLIIFQEPKSEKVQEVDMPEKWSFLPKKIGSPQQVSNGSEKLKPKYKFTPDPIWQMICDLNKKITQIDVKTLTCLLAQLMSYIGRLITTNT